MVNREGILKRKGSFERPLECCAVLVAGSSFIEKQKKIMSLFVRTSDDIAPIYFQHHVLISFEILQATAVSQQQSSGLKQITRPSCSPAYNSTARPTAY
jgi:hypothetical protein